jgi:TPR repeat protein
MYRLGTAELNGNLNLNRSPKEGVKWLKRSAEHATEEFPHALHELALLHERGIENVVFVDFEYAAELLAQGSELGYAPSAFKLGECYEYGKMGCPVDAALSIHYYVSGQVKPQFPALLIYCRISQHPKDTETLVSP